MRTAASTVLVFLLSSLSFSQDTVPRYEIGPVVSVIHLDRAFTPSRTSIGGRVTVNFSAHFALDSDLTITPATTTTQGLADGGRLLQGHFRLAG